MKKQIQKNPQLNKPELTYQKIISTSELSLAAYIKTRYKLPLVDVKKSNTGRITWSFELQDKDESILVHEFHTGGLVEASQFFSELRNLKAMTYTA